MAKDTRERMVSTTGRLLREQGFHATGLNQIVQEAHAPKGSMYFHFPGGKVQLAAEAVTRFGAKVTAYLADLLEQQPTAADAMRAYLAALAEGMEQNGFVKGCAVATVALEAGAQEPRLGDACDAALSTWEGLVAAKLEAEGLDAEDAKRRATLAVAAFEGGIMLAKARRSSEPLREVGAALQAILTVGPAPAATGAGGRRRSRRA